MCVAYFSGVIMVLYQILQEFFENPAFRADGLKLYPTLVIRGTGLYELWKTGRYKSYPPSVLVDLVARILALVPPWTRVYRVQRSGPWVFSYTNWFLGRSGGCKAQATDPMESMETFSIFSVRLYVTLCCCVCFWEARSSTVFCENPWVQRLRLMPGAMRGTC